MRPGAWNICPGMGGADSYNVTLLGARSSGRDGSLGRCDASAVGSPLVHDKNFNNPANAVVELRGRASFPLANRFPQSANDEFSVRSNGRIVESSDEQFGTSVSLPFACGRYLTSRSSRTASVRLWRG